MKGHGGNKHRENAEAFMDSARKLHASTKNYRQVNMCAGSAVEALFLAIGLKSRDLLQVPNGEHGGRWHDLSHLCRSHGVEPSLMTAARANPSLMTNWLIVRDWKSDARFADLVVTKQDALDMLNAVGHASNGIYQWLLNHYETI